MQGVLGLVLIGIGLLFIYDVIAGKAESLIGLINPNQNTSNTDNSNNNSNGYNLVPLDTSTNTSGSSTSTGGSQTIGSQPPPGSKPIVQL